jgi:hypothetical protein
MRYVVLGTDPNKERVGGSASCCQGGSRVFCFDPDHLPVDGTSSQKVNVICIPECTGGGVYRLIEVELIDEVLNLRRGARNTKYIGIRLDGERRITRDRLADPMCS